MENLSEDEALPNYNYQPQYNLHGLVDINTLQQYTSESQAHHNIHNSNIHPTPDLQTTHLSDYTSQPYGGGLGVSHSGGYGEGQMAAVYPTSISPLNDQQLSPNSSLGISWSNPGLTKVSVGRWNVEETATPQHRVEVGELGWTDRLHKNMHQLMEVDMMCDTIILTNTQQIKVHKLILMSSSDYLLTLLKRYDHLKMLQLRLPITVTMEALKTFVTFLYLGKANLTADNINDIAALSKIFKIQVMKDLIMKLSGNEELGADDKSFDIQPMVIDVSDRVDRCTDTNSLVATLDQGVNTISESSFESQAAADDYQDFEDHFPEPSASKCKKLQKKVPVAPLPSHTYGTRSSIAPKGTPKARRKSYLEEISKQVTEQVPAEKRLSEDLKPIAHEVFRGKKSRLLASALKQESVEAQTPKTRGKLRRKLEAMENSTTVEQQPLPLTIANSFTFVPEEPNSYIRKGRFRKLGFSEQIAVRAPPKKRAKMAMQLSEDTEREDPVQEIKTHVPPSVNNSQPPQNKAASKNSNSEKYKKRRINRWGKSKNLIGIACEVENMAEHIPENERQFKCNLCGNEFVFSKRCISHMVKTHAIPETDVISNIIIRRKEDSDPKICDICGYKTKDQNFCYIHYHKYFKHGIPLPKGWEVFKCDECGKECFTKFMLKDHKLTHKEETPFICDACGQGFKTRTCLNSHVFHRHKEVRNHSCPNCAKTFKTRTQMKVHMRTHTGEKPFHCPNCMYKSTTRGNMRLHLTNRHKLPSSTVQEMMDQMTRNLKPLDVSVKLAQETKEANEKEQDISLKQPCTRVKDIVDQMTGNYKPSDKPANVIKEIDEIKEVKISSESGVLPTTLPIEIIAIDNAKLTSVHIPNFGSGIKWTDVTGNNIIEQESSYACTVPEPSRTQSIFLPVTQTDSAVDKTQTYTLLPNSSILKLKSTGVVEVDRSSTPLKPASLSPPPSQQNAHLYMQHSPISPVATVSPESQFQLSHNIINSPITPPVPSTAIYPSSTNLVNSPINSPHANTSYQSYAQNLSSSSISPPAPTISDNQSYQTITTVSPVNMQAGQAISQETVLIGEGEVDVSYSQQQYDSALLQVYYQQQNFYQQGY